MKSAPLFETSSVEETFLSLDEDYRDILLEVRRLIFDVAQTMPEVGRIEETLKWGQPAYLTPETKSGSTIRLGISKDGAPSIYTHCQTTIMSDFKTLCPDDFRYDGNRGVHIDIDQPVPFEKLQLLIARALTYHLKSGA